MSPRIRAIPEAVRAVGRVVSPQVVAVGLAVVVLAAAGIRGSRAAGGSDSYGYVSQAYRWLSGDLKQPMPWTEELPWPSAAATFQPLGYNRRPADTTLVPVYSPGLPLLMAGLISLAGACGAFLVVPLCGAVAVFATYHLGRSIASAWAGVAGAWFLATSPTFLHAVMQPMSDVPVTMAWVLAFAFAARGTTWAALAAGAATSWAVLIRVNLAPLAAAVLLWFAVRGWRNRSSGAAACWPPVVYGLASVPGMIIAGALNLYLNGSPFLSGYGDNSYLFRLEHVPENLRLYPAWLTETQTPVVWFGVLALVVPWRRVWPSPEARLLVACLALFALGLWAEYLIYGVFDAWWYLRFLLPAFPLVFVALGQLASRVSDRPWRRAVLTLAIGALGIRGVTFARDHHTFDLRQGNSQFVTAARVARAVTEPTSVILSMQHSGGLRHYAGRMTMRYDVLEPGWLDGAVSWLSDRGVHVYALLDEFEVQAWRERFAGQHLGALDFHALREFEGSSGMMLYDLTAPGVKLSRRVATSPRDLDCHPPAPMAPFPLANRSR